MIKEIDSERVERLISIMREAIATLREIQSLAQSDFFADKHMQSSAKYNFIVAIEAAIDLASHIISKRAFRAPEDYADTFKVLADAGVLESEFSLKLEKMALFRNRLVLIYWGVDVAEVWKILQSRLEDFEEYISQVGKYLASRT